MVHIYSSTMSQRIRHISALVAHEGTYGVVSQLSRSQQVSRQTLYSWKQKGYRALEAAFVPKQSQGQVNEPVDLPRAVLTLLVEGHASYRGIQTCLAVLLGQHVSLGTITDIVQRAGEKAQEWLEQQVSAPGRVLALDEQYSSKRGEAYQSAGGCPQCAGMGELACGRGGWRKLDAGVVVSARAGSERAGDRE
jgi:hypothetical protein